MRKSLTIKLVRNQLKWAGHVDKMEGVRSTKRLDALGVEGIRRRGTSRLRWEDCANRDLVGI